MFRPSHRVPVAVGLLALVAVALSGCGGSSLPALTDPSAIVTAGLKATEGAKSVHVDVTLDGSISADLTGTGGKAQAIPLSGTTASADVDIAGGKAHATFAVPAFLNLSGDLIQIGTTSYYKTSLGGPLYEQQDSADQLPVNPTDTAGIFDNIGDALSTPGVDPVKGDDVDCGGKQCYTVMIELTSAELAKLGATQAVPTDLPVDLSAASLSFTIRVEKDTYRLAGIRTVASLGETGTLTLDVTLTKWDQPMDISPPPADQIGTGS
jgi:hypothetical protein